MITLEEVLTVISLPTLEVLVRGGLFDTKNGSVTVHFDSEGIVRKMERNFTSFKT